MLTPAPFPAKTAWSVVLQARDASGAARHEPLSRLASLYWKPVHGFLLRRWSLRPEDAADLAQEFFLALLEEGSLRDASPERGRFRTFLKLKLRDLVVDDLRKRGARKRGGGAFHVPIAAEGPDPAWNGLSPEEAFDREWAACVMNEAVRELERALDAPVFGAFRGCVLQHLSYRDSAAALGIKEGDVRNYVFRARSRLREILLARVRDSVEDEAGAEGELAYLMRLFA